MKKLVLGALAGAVVSVASAREWTVDAAGGGDYMCIQDAIDAAAAGDTVWVKPGVYQTGGRRTTESGGADNFSRVLLTKPLTLAATSDDPADTHIVGAPDPNPAFEGKDYEGRGPDSYRCIRLERAAAQGATVIRGFTIRDGFCAQRYNGDSYGADVIAGQPGGVASSIDNGFGFYVTDCVISNCFGVRGGLVRSGNYVRCRFSDGHGSSGAALGRNIRVLSSLIVKMPGACVDYSTLVNCTFADSKGAPLYLSSGLQNMVCNTICAATDSTAGTPKSGTAKNSVFDWLPIADAANCHVGLAYQFFAPLKGDFRIRAGTVSATAGDAALIAAAFPNAPQAVDLYRSLDGSSFASSGEIPVGCYAKTVVAAGGAVQFNGANTVVCEGYAGTVGGLYAFSETPYAVFQVRPPAGTAAYFGFARAAEQGGYQFPEMDESLWVAVPPADIVVTNTAETVQREYWVDPVAGSDENAGTAANAPLKTLAKVAANLALTASDAKLNLRTLVHCAAGDYSEGGVTVSEPDVMSRLALTDYRLLVRFKGAGRGQSFISGAPDPDSADGRGPNAVRCLYFAASSQGRVAVQGFTLCNGFADAGDADEPRNQGGLVWCGGGTGAHQVLDGELVGGDAFRGGIAMRGDFLRCIFRDAVARGGGGTRGVSICNSVFFGGVGPVIGSDTSVRQTTISSTNGVAVLGSVTTRFAVAFQATGCTSDLNLKNADACRGLCYSFDNGKTVTGDAEGVSTRAGDLRFVDFAHDDLRLRSDSPLVMDPIALDADYWKAPVTDVEGVPFSYKGGKTVAGGILTPVPVLVVETPAFGSATSVGTNVVEVGKTLTVDFTGSTKRHLEALLVNGEPVEGTSYTFAPGAGLAADGAPIPSVTLSYLYSTNWYVNATTGSDANDGFTAETPWKTLAQVSNSGLMLPGDCVHAAAGDYAEGTVAGLADGVGSCRVLLPTGVMLVADEGAEKTRIVGAADTSVSDSYGRGPNAVRCAYLQADARLVGFTLASGRVPNAGGGDVAGTPSCVGGGLYSEELATAYSASATGGAFDCVFTDCVAGRGGAAFGTRLVNCTIRDCVGTACSPVAYKSALYGCAVNQIKSGPMTLFRNCYVVSHGTVGANVTAGPFFDSMNAPATLDGNVLLAKLTLTDSGKKLVYANCLLNMDEEAFASLDAANRPSSVRIASAAEAGYSDAGRPLSAKALGVDKVSDAAFVAATDADGLPRISNGTMDLGAFEFDWRPIYAQDLGSVGTVVRADAPVVEKDGQVFLPQGELELVLADDAQRGRYSFPVQVTGTGLLTIRAGDETLATFDAADGAVVFRYRTRTDGNSLTFAYAPGDGDTGGALLAQASGGPGLVFVIR